jgi:hypothetical protein
VISCLSFFLVLSQSFSTPFYPQSVTSQGMCPNSLFFRCFHFKLTFEYIKELGGVSFACSFEIKIGNAKVCKSNEKHEKGCVMQIRL